ncbi:MAG: glutamine--fructose-6-phosphate aminotransferase [Desulfobacter postgatei]|uniref:Glutamine--fructose-6-phosphate aminotransferase [isomerizing] n=1 Tax=Desulfobacter postgatei TaxID=2293 RepID=A0A2G6MTP3_9BACT|nr:MAG: glutamine--fructose-6-phosphate aminotransferase [Desulfobacter postgatei]
MKRQGKFSTRFFDYLKHIAKIDVSMGKPLSSVHENTLLFFPDTCCILGCGICALVAFKGPACEDELQSLSKGLDTLSQNRLGPFSEETNPMVSKDYLGGAEFLSALFEHAQTLKQETIFASLFYNQKKIQTLSGIIKEIEKILTDETRHFKSVTASLSTPEVEIAADHIEQLKDILWCLKKEIISNIEAIEHLAPGIGKQNNPSGIALFKRINAVLNSLDRLEVRGRDSAGISVLCTLDEKQFSKYKNLLAQKGIANMLEKRSNRQILSNNTISINEVSTPGSLNRITVCFVYKFAAEIGALGDNIAFIRNQIRKDLLLQTLAEFSPLTSSVSAHTRWASVGDITEANCHPLDNAPTDTQISQSGIIHVCLNGDIDNYLELKTEYEAQYDKIDPQITTDTKLIPLQIEHHLKKGAPIEEAFRLAVNEFEGSHAISMHTDLAPGKLFLAQKGSGQAIFVGLAPDHYITASELYGVVEQTRHYIKLNGEDKGQIVILDQESTGGIEGVRSYYYDKQPITLTPKDVLTSQITSRDIDRQGYSHYFLKEISESPVSVEKTLENKFKQNPGSGLFNVNLNRTIIPPDLEEDLRSGKIKKIYFIGQGTAGIAAQGCADLLTHYLGDKSMNIRAQKASELSGFNIGSDGENTTAMEDTLVVAISQSGTTTDTNRTVDMIRAQGARSLAIVNRRDSDLTFKVDGVLYTSSGRDIEMSVASTKAFYSQITAGAVLGLHLAALLNARTEEYISDQIHALMELPAKMKAVLDMRDEIKECADTLAISKTYWATVGSGANKTSADEIRIKLSELCYKTISSDFVEDKKHIDLSSEPLIIVCAAGTRESVLGDIIKDTSIFHAHKACPIVITTQGEDRFDLYAKAVFKIPEIQEHFAPVLNTLVGHIWGYYAALAINAKSKFLYDARQKIENIIEAFKTEGHDDYEVLLENKFTETVAEFYNQFSQKRRQGEFPGAMGMSTISDMTLLLKYLSGRLPVSDFEVDFGVKGTPSNMLSTFFSTMNQAINIMARPVDAIKHQAKTVTVGTSRISERFEGIVFDALAEHNIQIPLITNTNVLVLKNLQEIISEVKGAVLYRITGLNLLGKVTEDTRIEVVSKTGVLANESSRVETDHRLKGTKNIIVREGNVYIGQGRKDNRSILVIPVLSSSPASPNIIEFLLSLNIAFKSTSEVTLLKKIKALGGKYSRLKDWVLESKNVPWDDKYLNLVDIETLFGATAERAVEAIVEKLG